MKNGLNLIPVWFSVVMVALVVAGAFAFAFTDFMSDRVFGTKRWFMVVLFIAYAVYRSIRIYQTFKKLNHENE